jgi:hypothetical protein
MTSFCSVIPSGDKKVKGRKLNLSKAQVLCSVIPSGDKKGETKWLDNLGQLCGLRSST